MKHKNQSIKIDKDKLYDEIFGDLRPWQKELVDTFLRGNVRQFFLRVGRRGGKDHLMIRIMVYLLLMFEGWRGQYCFPTLKMANEIIHGLTDDGEQFLGFIPEKYIAAKEGKKHNEIWFINGSTLNWDGVEIKKGKNMRGKGNNIVMFSEYAFIEKAADIYAAVAGSFRQGQKQYVFIASTPNGRNNDFYNKFLAAQKYPQYWYNAHVTIKDYMNEEDANKYIEELRSQGLTEDDIQRELYGSFEAASSGAILAEDLRDVVLEDHDALYDPEKPVHTGWDLGWTDLTVIWLMQKPDPKKNEYRILGGIKDCEKCMEQYATMLSALGNKYLYNYKLMGVPHDADDHSGMIAEVRADQLRRIMMQQGHKDIQVRTIRKVQRGAVATGLIDSRMRMFLRHNKVRWAREAAELFYELRGEYRRDPDTRELIKNQAIHVGSAFRTLIDLIVTHPHEFNANIREDRDEWTIMTKWGEERQTTPQAHPNYL